MIRNTYPPLVKIPRLIQLHKWLVDPQFLLAYGMKRYGDTFTLRIGSLPPLVVTGRQEIVQKVFQDPVMTGDDHFIFEPVLGTQSIIVATGERHKELRTTLMPFFQGRYLRSALDSLNGLCENHAETMKGTVPSLRREMESLTLKVMIQFLFGRIDDQLRLELIQTSTSFLEIFRSWTGLLGLFIPPLRFQLGSRGPGALIERKRNALDQVLDRVLRDTPQEELADSIVGALAGPTAYSGMQKSSLTSSIRDQIRTLLFAGYETTSSALTWYLYHLARDPDYQARVRTEISQLEGPEEVINLEQDSCLSCGWNETLRLYPIAPIAFVRRLTLPMATSEFTLPEGSLVAPCMMLSHNERTLWGEDSDHWRPDRFVGRKAAHFQFYPFGGGIRRCVGAALATIESSLIVRSLLTRYALSDLSPKVPYLKRRGITMLPSSDITLKFSPL